jgi:hypothetical protein
MKKILRSTAILAASIGSMLPLPQSKPPSAKQKKHGAATHSQQDQGQAASGDGEIPTDSTGGATPLLVLAPTADTWATFRPALLSTRSICEGRFPWKRDIVTTTFWIGEDAAKNNPVPNRASSWDPHWAKSYGGTDTPDASQRVNYRPAAFVPDQNPFYVALPYNDLQAGGIKPEAEKIIPWFKEEFKGPGKSVCKDRWVAIRYKGRVSYAQWEDCGPFRTDHSEYVFGDERPKPNLNKGAGLDVSPAVRDYLGMDDTDVTDWRFVDIDEVPEGPWTKHGDNNPFATSKRLNELRVAVLGARKPAPE